jgi:hypothetical protein
MQLLRISLYNMSVSTYVVCLSDGLFCVIVCVYVVFVYVAFVYVVFVYVVCLIVCVYVVFVVVDLIVFLYYLFMYAVWKVDCNICFILRFRFF